MTLQAPNEYGTLQFYDCWFSEQFLLLCAIVFRKPWLMSGKFPGTRLLAQSIITDVIWTIWNREWLSNGVFIICSFSSNLQVFLYHLSSTELQHKTQHLDLFSIAYDRKTSTTKANVPKDTWWCEKRLYLPVFSLHSHHRLHSRFRPQKFPPKSWEENFTEPLRKKLTS